jgi:small-conductance mechanosensitive channel
MTRKLRLLSLRKIVAILLFLLFSAATAPCTTAQAQKAEGQPSSWLAEVIKSGASAAILKQYSPKLAQLQDTIEKHAAGPKSRFKTSEELEKAIGALEEVRPKLREFVSQLAPKLKEAQAKLEKLGPPPKEGASESEELASQRKAISDEVAAYDGLIKRAEVLFVQADQFISAHNARRRQQFLSGLLRRSVGITDYSFIANLKNAVAIHSRLAVALATERLTPC